MSSQSTSLRSWAIENRVWEPSTWEKFLREYLVPLYKDAWTITIIYSELQQRVSGKELASIEDIDLRERIRAALYGGVEKDPKNSYAKFMYDYFGIEVENARSFEESVELYKRYGDLVKIYVGRDYSHTPIAESIKTLCESLEKAIRIMAGKLKKSPEELGLTKDYKPEVERGPGFLKQLLPKPGEKAEKLVSLINGFRKHAVDLAIGHNPYTTFIYYVRLIPVPFLKKFLEPMDSQKKDKETDEIKAIAELLDLKARSLINDQEERLSPEIYNKLYLFRAEDSFASTILNVHQVLLNIVPEVSYIYNEMINDAINRLDNIPLDPWDIYGTILRGFRDHREDFYQVVVGSNGIISEIKCTISHISTRGKLHIYEEYIYKNNENNYNKLYFGDFLCRIFPLISSGIIEIVAVAGEIRIKLKKEYMDKWIDRVMSNQGKT